MIGHAIAFLKATPQLVTNTDGVNRQRNRPRPRGRAEKVSAGQSGVRAFDRRHNVSRAVFAERQPIPIIADPRGECKASRRHASCNVNRIRSTNV